MFSLEGKSALVTGSGSGIGRAIAQAYANQGATVWVADINLEGAEETVALITETGAKAHAVTLNITDAAAIDTVIQTIVDEAGSLDILVNNAGISHIGTVLETTEDDWDRIMEVNCKGLFFCSKAAVKQMLNQEPKGGVIVNMASLGSLLAVYDRFLYCASKGAVLQMTKCLALDHVKDNIRCNCICPARVHTPFVDGYLEKNYPGQEKEMFEKLSEYQPIGRMGKPEEIAALAVYLASDEAAFVTGSAYNIDGGVLAI
ncbi:MAG: SDR family oxidoreductase [Lentisphaeria bacterium]|nr:SDR family oxidoreductase [Lentisphaeria bacterium]NQZ67163.1 SDR family oxidoreductase [Lentisphaeria bacterium]